MTRFDKPGTPWHVWLIGLLSLAWNSFGGYDYYMTQTGNVAWLTPMTEPYGVKVEDAIAWFDAYPVWMDGLWGLGVWMSVAGALLLLMRSGFAYYAFILSLIGQLGALPYQLSNPLDGMTNTPVAFGMTAAITLLILLQIWYTKAMARRGVLR